MHRAAQQLGIFTGFATAGALGWYHLGPYRWLADAQLGVMDADYPFLTWTVLGLAIGLPLGSLASTIALRGNLRDRHDEMMLRYGWLVLSRAGQLMLVGIGLALVGTVLSIRAHTMGELTLLSVVELERGDVPLGTWVELIDGVPDPSSSLEIDHRTYVPVFATRETAMVFLEIGAVAHGVTDRGLLVDEGLPNLARIGFEDAGLLAPHHYVIEAGKDPSSEASSMAYLALFGVALWRRRDHPAGEQRGPIVRST